MNKWLYYAVLTTLLAFLLLASVYIDPHNLPLTKEQISDIIESRKIAGPLIFILLAISSIVIPPISIIPLLPIAGFVFGWTSLAIYMFIAWNIGSMIAFGMSRRYGRKVISKFVDVNRIDDLSHKYFPHTQKKTFWKILMVRMIVPVDFLSYALGLTRVKTHVYFTATLIGTIPFSIGWSLMPGLLNKFFNPLFSSAVILSIFVLIAFIWPLFRSTKG